MTLSGSAPPPVAAPGLFKTLWSLATGAPPCGVALARESGQLLAWDENHWLYLLDARGERQGQARPLPDLVAACVADDGSALAVAGGRGEVARLAPDLTPRWRRSLRHPAVTAALDPFGHFLAVSDTTGGLFVFDRDGRPVWVGHHPRPLHHLAFVPEAPFLLGAADFGLVVCLDAQTGHLVWRDGLPAHCGSLAASADGEVVVLACFSDGLRRYSQRGGAKGHVTTREPCRLAGLSFDGRLALVAGRADRLLLFDVRGNALAIHLLERPAVALALAALGERAVVALADGGVRALDLRPTPR
ncbi:MAG TPA: PQQ-binding-like beta-propeller repeat protein [Gemmataceae bacterium]|nr:PQQ-binding-like beta-propeller repeat protein [Gemmataceae bacterium]